MRLLNKRLLKVFIIRVDIINKRERTRGSYINISG